MTEHSDQIYQATKSEIGRLARKSWDFGKPILPKWINFKVMVLESSDLQRNYQSIIHEICTDQGFEFFEPEGWLEFEKEKEIALDWLKRNLMENYQSPSTKRISEENAQKMVNSFINLFDLSRARYFSNCYEDNGKTISYEPSRPDDYLMVDGGVIILDQKQAGILWASDWD